MTQLPLILVEQQKAARVAQTECKTCRGEGGWEAAASSTNYFWKSCPDCQMPHTVGTST